MTVVHRTFTWREKAALALDHCGVRSPRKHFKRSDIMKIRRAMFDGATIDQCIKAFNLDMSKVQFQKLCKELRINLTGHTRGWGHK